MTAPPVLPLPDELVLLALGGAGGRRRLTRALRAAEGGRRVSLRAARGRLVAAGLVERRGRRGWAVTDAAALRARRLALAHALHAGRAADPVDVELGVLLFAAGGLDRRLHDYAVDALLVMGHAGAGAPPSVRWLMARRGCATTRELAECLLDDNVTPQHWEDRAFDPGVTDGVLTGGC